MMLMASFFQSFTCFELFIVHIILLNVLKMSFATRFGERTAWEGPPFFVVRCPQCRYHVLSTIVTETSIECQCVFIDRRLYRIALEDVVLETFSEKRLYSYGKRSSSDGKQTRVQAIFYKFPFI